MDKERGGGGWGWGGDIQLAAAFNSDRKLSFLKEIKKIKNFFRLRLVPL